MVMSHLVLEPTIFSFFSKTFEFLKIVFIFAHGFKNASLAQLVRAFDC